MAVFSLSINMNFWRQFEKNEIERKNRNVNFYPRNHTLPLSPLPPLPFPFYPDDYAHLIAQISNHRDKCFAMIPAIAAPPRMDVCNLARVCDGRDV